MNNLALSVRQPHAEAILAGIKTIEYRSRPTKIRGRILIYASKTRYTPAEERRLMKMYGFDFDEIDDLPRGVVVGSVEIIGCQGGEWKLANPKRLRRPFIPERKPQPVWFRL